MREQFLLDPDVVYLNHGSYGACPRPVFERYQAWQVELEREPVLYMTRLPELLATARAELAGFVGAKPDDLTFVPNATTGVNMAARAHALRAGDEVLGTDLE
jgi:isopenicillin-N epimerase